MSILQMQRFSICAMKSERKAILEELQTMGIMEVDLSVVTDDGLQVMDTREERQLFERNVTAVEQALEVLGDYVTEKKSMFASLEGKALMEKERYSQVVVENKAILKEVNRVLELQKQIGECLAEIARLETQKEVLVPWLALDIPMNYKGSKCVDVSVGSIGREISLEEIRERLANHAPEADKYDLEIISTETNQTCIVILSLKSDTKALEEGLRGLGFTAPAKLYSETPKEQFRQLEEQVAVTEKRIEEKKKEIAEKVSLRKEMEVVSDYYRVRSQKYDVLGKIPQSEHAFFISGYVAEKYVKALKEVLERKYEVMVYTEELDQEEEMPILLENGVFAGSVEGVLSSYGLPTRFEVDPSKVMSMCYVFFFGIMLSDAAYGLIMALGCGIALKKFPRMSDSMQKSLRMFFYCGLSTVFWGVLFGGFFGDIVPLVSQMYFNKEVIIPALWFAPLDDPMRLLIASMLFGVIHLFLGLAMKGYMCLRDKKYMDFFCDVVLWAVLLIGLILMLLPSQIFVSMSQADIVFPPLLNSLAKWMAAGGALGIVLMSGRETKNIGLRVALGAYDLYNVTGWLSDVLSYSRLLALGLATGVVASVINKMGSMLGDSIIGGVLFLLVFLGGHAFNFGINVLGAYVHTCRLQYVEFFGKFYEGGGRAFSPFKANSNYVDVKEERGI